MPVDMNKVIIEARAFVREHAEAATDARELAYRAHRHAANQTARLPQHQSAAIVDAFVSAVNDLGKRVPRRTAAVAGPPGVVDFPDFLLGM